MRNYPVILTLALFLVSHFALSAQDRVEEKANALYKTEQYAEAIPLYEEILEEGKRKNTLSIQTKLAYCYRINNKIEQAEKLYAAVVQKRRAKAITYFYYAEVLMYGEKYKEAKQWLMDYKKLKPEDERADLMLRACDEVGQIQPYFPQMYITEFPHNSDADDSSPVDYGNGIVFSSDRKQGVKLLKQKSGWTGREYLKLYFSEKTQDAALYTEPKNFSGKLNELNKNVGNPSFTADENMVFFTKNNNELNKNGAYSLQLYQANSASGNKWKEVEKLAFCSPAYNYMHPAISPDGETLFFVSDKPRGIGGTDIYFSEKTAKGWSKPQNLGANINTPYHEGFPFLHSDNKLYFCSKGHVGYGGFDIYMAEQNATGEWQTPINLGKPVNSPSDDISIFLSKDNSKGMFTSSRKNGDDDIYLFDLEEDILAFQENPNLKSMPSSTQEQVVTPSEYQNVVSEKEETTIDTEPIQEETSSSLELKIDVEQKKPQPVLEKQANPTPMPPKQEPIVVKKETSPSVPSTKNTEAIKPSSIRSPNVKKEKTAEKELVPIVQQESNSPSLETLNSTAAATPQNSPPKIKAFGAAADTPQNFEQLFYALQKREVIPNQVFRMEQVQYPTDSFKVTPEVAKRLDELGALLQTFPDLKIELVSHTSSRGSDGQNLTLSEVRSAAAVVYLVRKGIDADRIIAKGQGEKELLNHCKNGISCLESEHQENERMEIKILQIGEGM